MTLVDAGTGEILDPDTTRGDLAHHEGLIETSLHTAGASLRAIRDGQLYRLAYKSFDAYVDERWRMSRPRAYELMAADEVVEVLSGMPDTPVPANPRQAAALAPVRKEPEKMTSMPITGAFVDPR